jgi:hypothetical protein
MDADGLKARAGGRQRSTIGLAIGGLAVFLGSFMTWSTCPDSSCGGSGGFPASFPMSGIEFGLGVVTAILGVQLALAGVDAYRRRGATRWWSVELLISVIVLIVIGAHLITRHVMPAHPLHGPNIGAIVVVIGAAAAAVASTRLRGIR